MVPFLAQIQPFAFNFAPRGWTLCVGQLLPIAQYSAVFSLVGTTFGGDGRTTFGIPDLRGRSMVGVGSGPGLETRVWGQRGGTNRINLTSNQMPQHSHTLFAKGSPGDQRIPTGMALAGSTGDFQYINATPTDAMNFGSIGNAGASQSIDIDNPFLGLYIGFALQGVYPSRS